jgi:hypothetical protein
VDFADQALKVVTSRGGRPEEQLVDRQPKGAGERDQLVDPDQRAALQAREPVGGNAGPQRARRSSAMRCVSRRESSRVKELLAWRGCWWAGMRGKLRCEFVAVKQFRRIRSSCLKRRSACGKRFCGFLLSRSLRQNLQSPEGVPRLRWSATSVLESGPKKIHQRATKLRQPGPDLEASLIDATDLPDQCRPAGSAA